MEKEDEDKKKKKGEVRGRRKGSNEDVMVFLGRIHMCLFLKMSPKDFHEADCPSPMICVIPKAHGKQNT
jgi:hypothetical protein